MESVYEMTKYMYTWWNWVGEAGYAALARYEQSAVAMLTSYRVGWFLGRSRAGKSATLRQ